MDFASVAAVPLVFFHRFGGAGGVPALLTFGFPPKRGSPRLWSSVIYEPNLAESWGQAEWQRAYRAARRAALIWAGLRLLSFPLLLLAGLSAAHEHNEAALKIPILKYVAFIAIFVITPLAVAVAVLADVFAAITGYVVVLAGELLRKEPELYEKETYAEKIGRKKNTLCDVYLAWEVRPDGSLLPRLGDLGCTSVHVRRRLRRSLREGEGVVLLGGADGRVFAKRACDLGIWRSSRT